MNITRNEDTGRMQRVIARRKRAFLRALATTGQSQAAFARDLGITASHLSQVINGKRDSDKLWDKINAFVTEHEQENAALAG